MEINYIVVVVLSFATMALGALWYGPLFGKKWMKIIGATEMDVEARKEMQKRAMPLYAVTLLLSLIQIGILAFLLSVLPQFSGLHVALLVWIAFIVPTVAAGAMWNNDSTKVSWSRFLIQAGFYLLAFVLFGFVLDVWI